MALPFMLKSHPSIRRRPDKRIRMHRKNNNNPGIHTLHSKLFTTHNPHLSHQISKLFYPRKLDIFSTELYNFYFPFCFPFSDFVVDSQVVFKCLQVTMDQVVRTRHPPLCEYPPFANSMQYQDQTIQYPDNGLLLLTLS